MQVWESLHNCLQGRNEGLLRSPLPPSDRRGSLSAVFSGLYPRSPGPMGICDARFLLFLLFRLVKGYHAGENNCGDRKKGPQEPEYGGVGASAPSPGGIIEHPDSTPVCACRRRIPQWPQRYVSKVGNLCKRIGSEKGVKM